MTRPRLGFLGIGLMGEAMVLRLLERGYPVTVWNLEPERLDLVVPHGAVAAPSPAAVAAASDIVVSCVLNAEAVENVLFGKQGVADVGMGGPAKLLIDCSTLPPEAARDFAARLRAATGMGFVDAPLSGGTKGARAGTLAVFAGGSAEDVAVASPVLHELGANVTHVGGIGAGQSMKMLNQAFVCTGFVLVAEVLAMAEKAGLDAAQVPQALAGGMADSTLLRQIWPLMQKRRFDPPIGYGRQLRKDARLVQAFTQALGLDLPVVATGTGQVETYVSDGNEMADIASIIRLYRPDPPP